MVRFGLSATAGGSAAGSIPNHIAALAAGVTRAMLVTKSKVTIAFALAVGLIGAGAGLVGTGMQSFAQSQETQVAAPPSPPNPKKEHPAKDKAPAAKTVDSAAALDPGDPLDATLLRWQIIRARSSSTNISNSPITRSLV
jgi:uncharacterized membrane protein YebE (DUF533 family)